MAPHFYVDESGNFKDSRDPVSAGGLILNSEVLDFRERLEREVPGFPWPLHAAHLNRPIVWALSVWVASAPDEPADAQARDVVHELRRIANPLLKQATVALRDNEWPDVEILQELEGALWNVRPDLMRDLGGRVKRGRVGVMRVGRSLHQHPGVVVASEASWGILDTNRPAGRTGHEPTDRYYAVLVAALDRARAVAEQSSVDRLLATVLTRHVYDPVSKSMRPLEKEDVERLIAELPHSGVVVDVQPIATWNTMVPPPCVVADLCTNVGRYWLRDPIVSLAEAEAFVLKDLGLAVRSGHPRRSHLVAVFPPGPGPWNQILPTPGNTPVQAPIGIRQWAWDQALERADPVPQ